jgi:23S rRNA pseudouridine1911/1915/1917 synthase
MTQVFDAVPGRLDAVVAERLRIARADAQRTIAAGGVIVDGVRRPKSFRLDGGERVEVDLDRGAEVPAEGRPVGVRYRDEHLAVVSKPARMPTHPTENRRSGTLVNSLFAMDIPLAPRGGSLRPGIVHRLDAGTSGLIVVASDDATYQALSEMFVAHAVDRRYLALVRGRVQHDTFGVEAPLGRRGARIHVVSGGREAVTAFEVRERFDRATLLEAIPRTGRTHQIRVHLSSIGQPILGDVRYGGGGQDARALGLERPFLHSSRIGFDHPITRQRIDIEEPPPDDLIEALRRLRDAAATS